MSRIHSQEVVEEADLQCHATEEVDQHFQLLFNIPKDSFLVDLRLDFSFCFLKVFKYSYHSFYTCWYHIHIQEVEVEVSLQYCAIVEVGQHSQLLFDIPMDSFLKD
jgi:hypothetical protein